MRAVALLVAGIGALAATAGVQAAAPAAPAVAVEVDAEACGGAGFTASRVQGLLLCTHSAPDAAPAPERRTQSAAAAIGASRVSCFGNGTSGKRVQPVYAVPEGQAFDGSAHARMINVWIPNMDAAVRSASRPSGAELGIRFVTEASCRPAVPVVSLPGYTATPSDGQFGLIVESLRAQGFGRGDRKYVVWFQGEGFGRSCGFGSTAADDSPGPTNVHNGDVLDRSGAANPSYAVVYQPCWGTGGSGADIELHELFHTLGAVQLSAPHSNGKSHCTDDADLLCYSEDGAPAAWARCSGAEQIDCGKDDYFNPQPSVGSYLSTHWNTANSRFLGEFPLTDLLPLPAGAPVTSP